MSWSDAILVSFAVGQPGRRSPSGFDLAVCLQRRSRRCKRAANPIADRGAMTDTSSASLITTATGNPWVEPAATDVVTCFLDQLVAGTGVSADLFAEQATLDATVPHWRLTVSGPDRIAQQFTGWFTFED